MELSDEEMQKEYGDDTAVGDNSVRAKSAEMAAQVHPRTHRKGKNTNSFHFFIFLFSGAVVGS